MELLLCVDTVIALCVWWGVSVCCKDKHICDCIVCGGGGVEDKDAARQLGLQVGGLTACVAT
jgi:hypothetical protein